MHIKIINKRNKVWEAETEHPIGSYKAAIQNSMNSFKNKI